MSSSNEPRGLPEYTVQSGDLTVSVRLIASRTAQKPRAGRAASTEVLSFRPDGSSAIGTGTGALVLGTLGPPDKGNRSLAVWFSVSGLEHPDEVFATVVPAVSSRLNGVVPSGCSYYGPASGEFECIDNFSLPTSVNVADVDCRVATGSYRQVAVLTLKGPRTFRIQPVASNLSSDVKKESSVVYVDIPKVLVESQWWPVAYRPDGSPVNASNRDLFALQSLIRARNGGTVAVCSFQGSPKDIGKIVLESRPYRRVRFRGVHLTAAASDRVASG